MKYVLFKSPPYANDGVYDKHKQKYHAKLPDFQFELLPSGKGLLTPLYNGVGMVDVSTIGKRLVLIQGVVDYLILIFPFPDLFHHHAVIGGNKN